MSDENQQLDRTEPETSRDASEDTSAATEVAAAEATPAGANQLIVAYENAIAAINTGLEQVAEPARRFALQKATPKILGLATSHELSPTETTSLVGLLADHGGKRSQTVTINKVGELLVEYDLEVQEVRFVYDLRTAIREELGGDESLGLIYRASQVVPGFALPFVFTDQGEEAAQRLAEDLRLIINEVYDMESDNSDDYRKMLFKLIIDCESFLSRKSDKSITITELRTYIASDVGVARRREKSRREIRETGRPVDDFDA